MQSDAVKTMPHAAVRVLAALVTGTRKESNGTMSCSNSYARQFGISSATTLHASLALLVERGLIVKTRDVGRLARTPAYYAVTWWPICNRDGQPVTPPEPASHAYLEWKPISPANGPKNPNRNALGKYSSVQWTGGISPVTGLNGTPHQSNGRMKSGPHQSNEWTYSRSRSGGSAVAQQLADLKLADMRALARAEPAIAAEDLAKRCKASVADAHRALQCLQAEAS